MTPKGDIRLLIVDDSALMREMIRALLEDDPGIKVVGEACNGRDAVAAVSELRPDVVTMDLEMPVMGGLEAIEEIMATHAVPILVVTTLSDAKNAFDAVARGALDLVPKSELTDDGRRFCRKLRLLASIKVITHIRGGKRPAPQLSPPPEKGVSAGSAPSHCRVIAIAASTGGPAALAHILARLPATLSAPILIAQHITAGFATGMVSWLNGLSSLPVKLARSGEPVTPGTVHIAPSESHMTVGRDRHILLREPGATDIYHPSCDRLLTSVAEVYGADAVGLILTGMGDDGAAGIRSIFAAGGYTVAEDKSTSIVFGMNQVAINGGSIRKVLPLQDIPGEISRLAGGPVRS